MKILVISLAGIGDTLMATPLIHELRANFPDATLDVAVMWPGSRDLLEGNPYVSSVHYKNLIKSSRLDAWRFLNELKRRHYDVSLNTYPQSRIGYRAVARLIGATKRLSHRYDNWTALDPLLVSDYIEQDYGLHAADNNLQLLKLLDRGPKLSSHNYELILSSEELKWAQQFVAGDDRRILGMHVGSGTTKNLALRRWPLDCWIEFIESMLAAHQDVRLFLFGGPEEVADHQTIAQRLKSDRLVIPQSKTFRQSAALIGKCYAFVSVDTSPMHFAAATKVPNQFVIETPTLNKTVEPYGQSFIRIPNPKVAGRNLDYYRYDGKGIKASPQEVEACMRSVTVDAVVTAVSKAM